MPPNHTVLVSAGVVAITVAVAAAIAVYESPELRRMADDLRRKVAFAFHSFGDVIGPDGQPTQQQPAFNRPEDADGFLQSRGSNDPGVVADNETLQRQRQELMYWNAIRLEKEACELMERSRAEDEAQKKRQSSQESLASSQTTQTSQTNQPTQLGRATTFDHFLTPDGNAGRGTFVFNTGASPLPNDAGLVQRRPHQQPRGLQSSVLSNPFGDENQVDELMAPSRDEMPDPTFSPLSRHIQSQPLASEYTGSDLYGGDAPTPKRRLSDAHAPILEWGPNEKSQAHVSPPPVPAKSESPAQTPDPRSPTLSAAAAAVTVQESSDPAFTSIQAWAQNQNRNPSFYSPIPVSPAAPLSAASSELDIISRGDLTPTDTDSHSLAGSGEDIASEARSRAGDNFDVLSESDGMATPASWTEVGSVVSEDDIHPIRNA